MMLVKAMIGMLATGGAFWAAVTPGGASSEMGQRMDQTAAKSTSESTVLQDPVSSNRETGGSKLDKIQSAIATGKADGPVPTAKPAFRGRLPRYYAAVVTPTQRTEIYSIQQRYRSQLEALEQQLAALKKQEQAEVSKVLDSSQREYVAEQMSRGLAGRTAK